MAGLAPDRSGADAELGAAPACAAGPEVRICSTGAGEPADGAGAAAAPARPRVRAQGGAEVRGLGQQPCVRLSLRTARLGRLPTGSRPRTVARRTDSAAAACCGAGPWAPGRRPEPVGGMVTAGRGGRTGEQRRESALARKAPNRPPALDAARGNPPIRVRSRGSRRSIPAVTRAARRGLPPAPAPGTGGGCGTGPVSSAASHGIPEYST
jgi:hypothetical protein